MNSIMANDLIGALHTCLCACLSACYWFVLSIHKVAGLLLLGSTASCIKLPLMPVGFLSLPQQTTPAVCPVLMDVTAKSLFPLVT